MPHPDQTTSPASPPTHERAPALILASGSRYRQQQLAQLGLRFQSISPDIDETARPGESAAHLCRRLAEAKALAIWQQYPNAWVLGSDQVADLHGQMLGKPLSVAKAEAQLRACSGKTVMFHSALCLVTRSGVQSRTETPAEIQSRTVITEVRFRDLSEAQITAYIKKENPLDCAGSFKCEGLGIALFESVRSDDPSALIGLPLIALTDLLRAQGLDPLVT